MRPPSEIRSAAAGFRPAATFAVTIRAARPLQTCILAAITLVGLLFSSPLRAAGVTGELAFNIPAQAADRALLAFAKQARVAILFSADDLQKVRSTAVSGRYSPERALELLLQGTGFVARRNGEAKWIVTPTGPPSGAIKGRILAPDGSPARRVHVRIEPTLRSTETDSRGEFELKLLVPGEYRVVAAAEKYRPLHIERVNVNPNQVSILEAYSLQPFEDPTRMEPFVVESSATRSQTLDHSESIYTMRVAGGNLDLARTESDVLPYMIFNRAQISRSGVVNLNEFLQREVIDSNSGTLPPEHDPTAKLFSTGSTNLSLRGYRPDETIILVNGRRLPEVMTSMGVSARPPDVNFIPLSLVQQVEVLPVSASALYTGNAVGGVINIVLRPDVDANVTEITATYTNAVGRFDAPQSSFSVLHAESLLKGALRVRLNASVTRTVPATEAELGHRQRRARPTAFPDEPVFGATPNVRSVWPEPPADEEPPPPPPTNAPPPQLPGLFGPGTSPVTSVAPGGDGRGGLSGFASRQGLRNTGFFDSPGAFSTAIDSLDFPYGRHQRGASFYGSVVYEAAPWLQLAVDATYTQSVMHRGYEVMQADLLLKAASPFNPFGQDVRVSLNELAPALGERYRESRLAFGSVVGGALIRLPGDWKVALDAQYSHNVVRYRGLHGAKEDRWQRLVDDGIYNPLRDTQVFGPPPEFYDQVLVYLKGRGRFATVGNYQAFDGAVRLTNEALRLPTGPSILNLGTDYRINHLASYTEEHRFSDGSLNDEPTRWGSRTLERYSFFGELQTPLVPVRRLPKWIVAAEADLALRYVASNSAKESNYAPTYGAKVTFPGGISVRGSVTTSSRYPTPTMSRLVVTPPTDGGVASPNRENVIDYRRGGEKYAAIVTEVINPDLRPEEALTQTAGILIERGRTHRFRAAIDFVETHKLNEEVFLDQDKLTANEALWPERIVRAAPARGESVGLIQTVFTGRANLSTRKSQNWTASLDYRGRDWFGGTIEAYSRLLYFQRYRYRILPFTPRVDELKNPEGLVPLLRYRANVGASWSNRLWSFGAEEHYYHSRVLPRREWAAQGRTHIRPYWQTDVFVGADLARWLPWKTTGYSLRGQLRVNNVFATPFPKYVNDPYNTGVQNYGDWRGRVYSLSVTASF